MQTVRRQSAGFPIFDEPIDAFPSPPPGRGVLALLAERAASYAGRTAFSVKEGGTWRSMSYGDVLDAARPLSSALLRKGHPRGARMAILSENKPEWGIAFFAALRAGGIVVPLDTGLSTDEISRILLDARPTVLFCSRAQLEKGRALLAQLDTLVDAVLLECRRDESDGDIPVHSAFCSGAIVPGVERSFDEVALLAYTSGTTGEPKGVMVPFSALVFEVNALASVVPTVRDETLLSILPLHHLFELTGGFLAALFTGSSICYLQSLLPDEILPAMREKRVTRMLAVPLFFKLMKREIERQVRQGPAPRRALFTLCHFIAAVLPFRPVRRALFAPLHARFGGRLQNFICGGAPLDASIEGFFFRIGLPVLQGYGLSETSPVVATNTPKYSRPGTVGRPLPGLEVRIAGDGEILVRGPAVMRGYHGRPDLTRAILDDAGFLHTGDLGLLDEDGYLRVTGRRKDLLVMGSGKKVQPDEVEQVLDGMDGIAEACVVGVREDGESGDRICVVVVPDASGAGRFRADAAAAASAFAEAVRARTAGLAPYKRPALLAVSLAPLARTTTRKVKRADVTAWAARAARFRA